MDHKTRQQQQQPLLAKIIIKICKAYNNYKVIVLLFNIIEK